MERLAVETSKIKGISIDHLQLEKLLKSKPIFTTFLLAAAKLDDDIKKGLMPKEFGNVNLLSSQFSELFVASNITNVSKIINQIDEVKLPPFTKHVLIRFLRNNNSNENNENFK